MGGLFATDCLVLRKTKTSAPQSLLRSESQNLKIAAFRHSVVHSAVDIIDEFGRSKQNCLIIGPSRDSRIASLAYQFGVRLP